MTVRADFECPEHGIFEADIDADAEEAECQVDDDCWGCGGQPSAPGGPPGTCEVCMGAAHAPCHRASPWVPAPVRGKVRAVEVVRGGWEKPARETFLDTRNLGEGQDHQDWLDARAEIRQRQRQAEAKDVMG